MERRIRVRLELEIRSTDAVDRANIVWRAPVGDTVAGELRRRVRLIERRDVR